MAWISRPSTTGASDLMVAEVEFAPGGLDAEPWSRLRPIWGLAFRPDPLFADPLFADPLFANESRSAPTV